MNKLDLGGAKFSKRPDGSIKIDVTDDTIGVGDGFGVAVATIISTAQAEELAAWLTVIGSLAA